MVCRTGLHNPRFAPHSSRIEIWVLLWPVYCSGVDYLTLRIVCSFHLLTFIVSVCLFLQLERGQGLLFHTRHTSLFLPEQWISLLCVAAHTLSFLDFSFKTQMWSAVDLWTWLVWRSGLLKIQSLFLSGAKGVISVMNYGSVLCLTGTKNTIELGHKTSFEAVRKTREWNAP